MNDRYLFRAKRIDNDEWAEGFYALIGKKHVIISKESEGYYTEFIEERHGYEIVEVDPSTICQCTGLRDKNGKMIWENDICKVGWIDNEAQAEGISKVTWDKNGYYPWLDEYSCDGCDLFNEIMFIEVIGNIIDNPELLEQEG